MMIKIEELRLFIGTRLLWLHRRLDMDNDLYEMVGLSSFSHIEGCVSTYEPEFIYANKYNYDKFHDIVDFDNYMTISGGSKCYSDIHSTHFYFEGIGPGFFKPIVYPLSVLEGRKTIPTKDGDILISSLDLVNANYETLTLLASLHIDVFGWLDDDLAINRLVYDEHNHLENKWDE